MARRGDLQGNISAATRSFPGLSRRVPPNMTISCPHCGAANTAGAAFCAGCGKALPSAAPAGPRLVTGGATPTSSGGHALLGQELHKQTKKAFGALLAVGIIQLVFGLVVVGALESKNGGGGDFTVVYLSVFGIGVAFLGLAFWARFNPLPPAIVGLVLFVSVHLLDAVADPASLARGLIMKIIIVVVLSKAISAGLKYRQLMQSGVTGG
jgi:hypothetical protein